MILRGSSSSIRNYADDRWRSATFSDEERPPLPLETSAAAYASAWKTQAITNGATVTDGQYAIVLAFIGGLIADGTWPKFNTFFPFWLNNSIACYVDFVSAITATPVGSPTFNNKAGIGPLDGSTQWIDLNTTGKFRSGGPNSAAFCLDLLNNKGAADTVEMGTSDASNAFSLNISVKWGDGTLYSAANDTNTWGGAAAASDTTAIWSTARNGATAPIYKDSTLFATNNNAANSNLPTYDILVGAGHNTSGTAQFPSTGKFGMAATANDLSITDVANLVTRWNTFKTDTAALVDGTEGTLAVTLDAATLSATATVTIQGSTSATLAAAALAGTGTVLVQGTTSSTLAAATLAATGTVVAQATLGATLAAATLSASGTVAAQSSTGTLAVTLVDATLGSTAGALVQGTLGATLAAATLSAAGSLPIGGSVNSTFNAANLVATGAALIKATLGSTLSAATLSATAASPIQGTTNATLAAASLVGTGAVLVKGTLAGTLDAATLVASSGTSTTGSLSATLANAELAASGVALVKGTAAVTLDVATLSAVGIAPAHGTLSNALADAALTGTGRVAIEGALGVTLETAVAVGVGKSLAAGSLSVTLDEAIASIVATASPIVFSDLDYETIGVEPLFSSGVSVLHGVDGSVIVGPSVEIAAASIFACVVADVSLASMVAANVEL